MWLTVHLEKKMNSVHYLIWRISRIEAGVDISHRLRLRKGWGRVPSLPVAFLLVFLVPCSRMVTVAHGYGKVVVWKCGSDGLWIMSRSCLHSAMVIYVYCNAVSEGLPESPEDQSLFCESYPASLTALRVSSKTGQCLGSIANFFRDLRECHKPYSFDLWLFLWILN